MEIYEGMPVKDALINLEKKYSIFCFGRLKRSVDNIPQLRNKLATSRKTSCVLKLTNETQFKHLQKCFSTNVSSPVKFVNDSIGIIPTSWSIGQFLSSQISKSKKLNKDKKDVMVELIESAESYEDIDWVLRFAKRSKIFIDNVFEEKLYSTKMKKLTILDGSQKRQFIENVIMCLDA